MNGSGSIGWELPKSGTMTIHAEATDLAPFDSLGLALTGFSRDSTADNPIMEGKATADLTLQGALGALEVDGTVLVNPFRWLGYKATNLRGQFAWASRDSAVTASVSADSLIVRSMVFSSVDGERAGAARLDAVGRIAGGEGFGADRGRRALPDPGRPSSSSMPTVSSWRCWAGNGAWTRRSTPGSATP